MAHVHPWKLDDFVVYPSSRTLVDLQYRNLFACTRTSGYVRGSKDLFLTKGFDRYGTFGPGPALFLAGGRIGVPGGRRHYRSSRQRGLNGGFHDFTARSVLIKNVNQPMAIVADGSADAHIAIVPALLQGVAHNSDILNFKPYVINRTINFAHILVMGRRIFGNERRIFRFQIAVGAWQFHELASSSRDRSRVLESEL